MRRIADGAIEVTASGASIRCVRMAIDNREDSAFSFVIPTGTLIDSGGGGISEHDHNV